MDKLRIGLINRINMLEASIEDKTLVETVEQIESRINELSLVLFYVQDEILQALNKKKK